MKKINLLYGMFCIAYLFVFLVDFNEPYSFGGVTLDVAPTAYEPLPIPEIAAN